MHTTNIVEMLRLLLTNVTLKIKNTDGKNTYVYWLLRHLSVFTVFYFN